jgi:hypothetical protein
VKRKSQKMKISRARLRQIVTEEIKKGVSESWFRRQVRQEAWREGIPSGRHGEIFHLFFGDESLEGGRGSHDRVRTARDRAAQSEEHTAQDLRAAQSLRNKATKSRQAGEKWKADRWEDMAQEVDKDVEKQVAKAQPDFNLIEIYDWFLEGKDVFALQVAEEMMAEKGAESMSAIAVNPDLAQDFVDRHIAKGDDRARKAIRTGVLPDEWV